MPVCYSPGQVLGPGDLDIFFTDSDCQPMNVYEITYSICYVDPGPPEQEFCICPENRTPVNPSVGSYYASLMIPPSAMIGCYRIRWTFVDVAGNPSQEVVQEFEICEDSGASLLSISEIEAEMVRQLRIFLRDNNPDRNYHFRPPEHEARIKRYNRVFGFVWEDIELAQYLRWALDWWNMMPPETEKLWNLDLLYSQKAAWRTAILWGAAIHALFALSINWVHEEFDYSIGGISLSIQRSSNYESLKSNAESRWESAVEMKARTTKIMRGLQQPKYGIGIRSAFGPTLGRGVLSPRSFL